MRNPENIVASVITAVIVEFLPKFVQLTADNF